MSAPPAPSRCAAPIQSERACPSAHVQLHPVGVGGNNLLPPTPTASIIIECASWLLCAQQSRAWRARARLPAQHADVRTVERATWTDAAETPRTPGAFRFWAPTRRERLRFCAMTWRFFASLARNRGYREIFFLAPVLNFCKRSSGPASYSAEAGVGGCGAIIEPRTKTPDG